ncbi:MAG: FKBP-type peptidyl-prolyl cis-trans isomerase [Candidatus Nanopelagicales bacterium]|nr:FKBP-type peptidyl-prolyl cis-trans isomerase [Candidatus Nanopelagicales bacterium]
MPRRLARPAARLAIGGAALTLLAGCWTSGSDSEGTVAVEPTTPAAAPTVAAPNPVCLAGEPGAASYECEGVTVTGEQDAEPTIALAEDFPPATELQVADVYEGSGDPVQPGDTLTVQYVGVGQQSREVFDASWPGGAPATFPLDGVIQGWQEGMVGMTPGGRRLLIIPGSLAYGPEGRPPAIGPDETLVFVVDLISVEPGA